MANVGAERVLFAVDYPYEYSDGATAFLREAPLDDRERRLLGRENAEQLFRIPSMRNS